MIAGWQRSGSLSPQSARRLPVILSESETGNASEKEVTARIKLVTRESDKNVFFETRDRTQKDAWVHRNYIRKD
jgi:hypothetical protein